MNLDLELVLAGHTYSDIASELCIPLHLVKNKMDILKIKNNRIPFNFK